MPEGTGVPAAEAYQRSSKQVSELVRQLALAGIAIIWLFKVTDSAGQSRIAKELVSATLVIAAALCFDFLQYAYATAAWGIFSRMYEKRDEVPDKAPRWINWPTNTLFVLKVAAIATAYFSLGRYLIRRVI
jgi:hypothetical protein